MNQEFWQEKWEKNEIGFHLDGPHPWLIKTINQLNIPSKQSVFVPLCGKTHDIDFLIQQGFNVIANELSEVAVTALFERYNINPKITPWNENGKLYQTENLTVFVGDFFQLTPQALLECSQQPINWIYDRAALVALPIEMRAQYSKLLIQLCPRAQQILMTLDYPQELMPGPPFSVLPSEVKGLYSEHYNIEPLHHQDILDKEPRFKQRGLTEFNQRLYLLSPN